MKELIVNQKYDCKKLNAFLLDNFDGLNLNTIYKTLRKKDILINGARVNSNVTLSLNDTVTIYIADKFLFKSISLDVIYEDDNILVVNKPIGVEILSDKSKSLTDFAKEYCMRKNHPHR